MINLLTNIKNFIIFLYVYVRFFILLKLKDYFSDSRDESRVSWANLIGKLNFSLLSYIFKDRIKLNEKVKEMHKITILNSNHFSNFDNLILFVLLNDNKIDPFKISSISTFRNISEFDKKILNLIEAISSDNIMNEIDDKIDSFNQKEYNYFLITFFEGIALNHSKNRPFYKYLNRPKYLAFELLCNKLNGNKFYDLDLVYTYNSKIMNSKDQFFLIKLFHPKCKIYINVKICEFPKKNEREYLDNLYLTKSENIKSILNSI